MKILETSFFSNGDELVLMRYIGTYVLNNGEIFKCEHFLVAYLSAEDNYNMYGKEIYSLDDEEEAYRAFEYRSASDSKMNTLFGTTIEHLYEKTKNNWTSRLTKNESRL